MRRSLQIFLVTCTLLLVTLPAAAQEASPADQLRSLIPIAEEGVQAAEQNKPDLMRATYDEIHEFWETFEGAVREKDATGYGIRSGLV
jgi:hypothetical protein